MGVSPDKGFGMIQWREFLGVARVGVQAMLLSAASVLAIWGAASCAMARAAGPTSLQVGTTASSVNWQEREVGFVVDVRSGADGAQFGLALGPVAWPGSSKSLVGSPVAIANVALDGPGTLRPASLGPVPPPFLPRQDRCRREVDLMAGSRFWVELPGDAHARIVVDSFLAFPVWPGTTYGLAVSTFDSDMSTAPRTFAGAAEVPLTGRTGTLISTKMVTQGASQYLAHGESPAFVGTTNPPLRRGQISLRVVRPTRSGAVWLDSWESRVVAKLGAIRTDQHGRFKVMAGKALGPGRYALLARSAETSAILADWNCGPFFRSVPIR